MRDALEEASRPRLQAVLHRYGGFLDQRSGIFASVREYELPWHGPIHICVGDLKPEFSRSTQSSRPAISGSVAGAGSSALAARASCLCEALERYSGIFRGTEPRRVARYLDIAGEAIHPDALMLFSAEQYTRREEWNRREGGHNWVPERFDAERSVEWSPLWSLTHKTTKYLPTAYCYFGYRFDPQHDFCRPDSNGNAAGESRDEAIVHGFLELVERECAAVWWYNRIRRPAVDVDSFGLPDLMAVRNLFRMMGRSVEVLDITADRNVPVFVAVSRSEIHQQEDYALGFGAHLDAQIALARAIIELTQFVPAILSGREPQGFLRAENARELMSFLAPDERQAAIRRSDFPPPVARKPQQDVAACVELAKSWGLEMLVLDQTRDDVGMPVVKVVVPGMRSWWARFAPGRLYTLPIRLGWLAEPKTESELNPDHLIL